MAASQRGLHRRLNSFLVGLNLHLLLVGGIPHSLVSQDLILKVKEERPMSCYPHW